VSKPSCRAAAAEVAHALRAPLDVLVVRKLGVPGHEELAMGAIASGGVKILNADVLASIDPSPDAHAGIDLEPSQIDAVAQRELRELERCERLYRDDRGRSRSPAAS
jgi:putative phosphoribosyl transferase